MTDRVWLNVQEAAACAGVSMDTIHTTVPGDELVGAGGGNRTLTGGDPHGILSPARLPFSPPRRWKKKHERNNQYIARAESSYAPHEPREPPKPSFAFTVC